MRTILPAVLALASARLVFADGARVQDALAKANQLFDHHRYNEAKAAFAEVLALAPENGEANFRLGLYACDAGEWEKALAYEELALRQDPNRAQFQYGWASANGIAALKSGLLSKFGYAKKCLAAYRRAAELEPNNAQYRYALFSYYQQAPGFVGGDKDLAKAEATVVRKLDPVLGRQAWGLIHLMAKETDAAFAEYEVALREHPDDYLALYSFGVIAVLSGERIDSGLEAFRHCLRLDVTAGCPSHPEVRCKIAQLYEKKQDTAAARAEYLAALKEDANYWPAKHGLEKLRKS